MPKPLDADLRDRVAARLGRSGQRLTASRAALVAVLARARRPLTIPEIGKADADLAVSSIYRNLTLLVELDVVRRVVSHGDFAHYELAEELTDHHHHHLICSSCGGVEDFEAPAQLEASVRAASRHVTRRTGFRAERHLVDLIGVCANCS
ncbi:MAG: Fur family transcriptional regulator [Acidimicrobiia bacterium]